MPNPYYYPDRIGLTTIGAVDLAGDYEFCMFCVWQGKDGTLYWADDAGCSCPTPFESYQDREQLESGTPQQCHNALDEWERCSFYDRNHDQVVALHALIAGLS